MWITFIIAGIILLVSGEARAQIHWINPVQEKQADLHAKTVRFHFDFIIEGQTPLSILRTSTSCGCARVDPQALKTYPPGIKQGVVVDYSIGERTGRRIETLYLETDDPVKKVQELTIVVNIPDLVELSPGFLFWKTGEAPAIKELTLRWKGPGQGRVDLLPAETQGWKVKLVPIASGLTWKLQISPSSTEQESSLQVPLSLVSLETGPRSIKALAVVQKP
jgi:hypothetical protein